LCLGIPESYRTKVWSVGRHWPWSQSLFLLFFFTPHWIIMTIYIYIILELWTTSTSQTYLLYII
jgi:hypothetical protein